MNAKVLRDFFHDHVSARELAADLEGTTDRIGPDTFRHVMTDLEDEFLVKPEHLVRVCDAVLTGDVAPSSLREIGFGVIVSDYFSWDYEAPNGERVGETLHDWSSPEVNFALTLNTVKKFRHRLLTGENTLTRDDHSGESHVRGQVEYHSERRKGTA